MTRALYAIGVSVIKPPEWRAAFGPYESLFVFEMAEKHAEPLRAALTEDFWVARSGAPFESPAGPRRRTVGTGLPELIRIDDLPEAPKEHAELALFRWGRGGSLRPLPGRGRAAFRMLPPRGRPVNGVCPFSSDGIGLPAHAGERGLREEALRVGHLEFGNASKLLFSLADGRH